MAPQAVEVGEEIVFTYDVTFEESPIRWASRWDTYLQMEGVEIQWFSVVNSAMILIFLSGMVAMIMVRTLRRDISQYNELESLEEAQEETGWKLVHGDVFRPPPAPALLSVYVGTGVQLLVMTFVTMVFALLGFLSPANRGGLMTAMLMLFSLAGVAAGYHGARMFRLFQLQDWRKHTLAVAFSFPGGRVRRLLRPQPDGVGAAIVRRGTLRHPRRARHDVVRHLCPSGVRGVVLRG